MLPGNARSKNCLISVGCSPRSRLGSTNPLPSVGFTLALVIYSLSVPAVSAVSLFRLLKVLFDVFSHIPDLDIELTFGSRIRVSCKDPSYFLNAAYNLLPEPRNNTTDPALIALLDLILSRFTHTNSLGESAGNQKLGPRRKS